MIRMNWRAFGAIVVAIVMVLSSALLLGSIAAPTASAVSPGSSLPSAAPGTATSTAATSAATTTSNGIAGASPQTVVQSPARVAGMVAAKEAFLAAGGNPSDFFPPSVNAPEDPPSGTGGHVVPLYDNTPAPMGIGDYGLRTVNGVVQPYVLNTKSVEGTFTTTDPYGVQTHAYDEGASTSYGAQLNVIATNVTVKGQTSYNDSTNQYWIQSVLEYNGAAGTISWQSAIWNFTYNPQGNLPWAGYSDLQTGSILHGYGSTTTELYERSSSGTSQSGAYPYTMHVYINMTSGGYLGSNNVDVVYFNYSEYNALGQHICPTGTLGSGNACSATIGGTYDTVYFNSVTPVDPTTAQIQVNGYHYASNGNGTNLDVEFDYGIGTDGAEVTSTQYANAQLDLYTLNATTGKYHVVPSAYDFGTETGETTSGVYGTYSIQANGAPIEQFRTGPSILTGLWNASGTVGSYALNYANVEPENAFLAIAPGPGQTNQQAFRVAPTFGWFNRPTAGGLLGPNIWLQPGVYTVEVMLSGYNTFTENVNLASGNVSLSVNLVKNPASTTYTPLWAFSNAELAAISTSGAGTQASPYILWGNQQGSIAPVFGDLSQWPFEIWLGICLNQTTAYAQWNPLPSLQMTYPSWEVESVQTTPDGPLPLTNHLQIYALQVQNLTIANSKNISGWFASAGTTGYSMILNGAKNTLVYDNTFNVSNEGLSMTSGSNNTVFGNTFQPLNQYVQYSGLEHPSTGLSITDTRDHTYNNAFYTNSTASSTTVGDFWNVSCQGGYSPTAFYGGSGGVPCQPLSYSQVVNGWTLTGSIIGASYQGGNFWFNYGNIANPYQNVPYRNRASAVGGSARLGASTGVGDLGDYAPLLTFSLYTASFSESGLPSGTTWNVTIYNGVSNLFVNTTSTTTGTTLVFYLPNGAYSYDFNPAILTGTRYTVSTPAGSLTIAVGSLSPIAGSFVTAYLALFTESGLATGAVWGISIAHQLMPPVTVTASSSTTKIGVGLVPAGYSYTVRPVAGCTATYSGSFTVVSATVPIAVPFTQLTYATTFAESGLPGATNWFVKVGSTVQPSASTTDVFALANGTYAYNSSTAPASGYAANPASGTFVVAGLAVGIPVPYGTAYAVTFTQTGLPATQGAGFFQWSVNVAGQPLASSPAGNAIVLHLPAGSFNYWISSQTVQSTGNPGGLQYTGFTPNPTSGTLTVSATTREAITFSQTVWATTFVETGLPLGTLWNLTLTSTYGTGGVVFGQTTSNTTVLNLVNSTYGYVAAAVGYVASYAGLPGSTGGFLVWGFPVTVVITFTPLSVWFTEAGLPGGTQWAVTLGAMLETTTTTSIVFLAPSGTYSYSIAAIASGWTVSPSTGSTTVSGSSVSVPVLFTASSAPTYSIYFTASGIFPGTSFSVSLNGGGAVSSGGTSQIVVTNVPVGGPYSYVVTAPTDYTLTSSTPSSPLTVSSTSLSVELVFTPVTYTVTFTETGLPSGTVWGLSFGGVFHWGTAGSGASSITFQAAGSVGGTSTTGRSGSSAATRRARRAGRRRSLRRTRGRYRSCSRRGRRPRVVAALLGRYRGLPASPSGGRGARGLPPVTWDADNRRLRARKGHRCKTTGSNRRRNGTGRESGPARFDSRL